VTRGRRLLWVAVAVAVLAAASIAIFLLRCPTMKHDEFLGPVKSQLMRPPPSSEVALVAAAEGREPPDGVLSVPAHDYGGPIGAPGTVAAYDAPPSALCLAFEQELGRYDIVRCRYQVHDWQVDLAVAAHVSAIRLSGSDMTGDPLAVAQQVAREVFEPDEGVLLRIEGCDGEITFGTQDVEATGPRVPMEHGGWQHWRDSLAWWHEPGQVGFITIHADGVPTRQFPLGAAEGANRRWFSEDMPEWYFARDLERLVGPVQKQLMLPPLLRLHAAIDAQTRREHPPDGVSVVPATDSIYVPPAIRGLRLKFQVPPSALCFAFEQEPGRFDLVRCQYDVEGWFVVFAATAQLMAISVNDNDRPEGEPVADTQLVAEALFEPGTKLALHEVGRVSHFTVGELTAEAPAPSAPMDGGLDTPWRETYSWWYRRGEVGFIAVKQAPGHAAGQPPPEVTEQANKRWFSKDEPDWFRPRKR